MTGNFNILIKLFLKGDARDRPIHKLMTKNICIPKIIMNKAKNIPFIEQIYIITISLDLSSLKNKSCKYINKSTYFFILCCRNSIF